MQIQSKWKETIRKAQDVKELFSAFKEAISKKNTFPYAEVEAAYRHSISNHGGMARLEKEWLDNALKSLSETLDTEGEERYRSQIPQTISAFERKYLQKRKSVWDMRSGVYSGFIAGRSKLNSKQVNSRNSGLDRAEEAFNSWMKAEIQAIYDEYGVTTTRRKAEQAKNAKKQAIREWESELKKKLKAEEKKLPIINQDGEGYKRMTSAEWAKTHSDYKGIMVSGNGNYRYRAYMTTPVFITDKPVKLISESAHGAKIMESAKFKKKEKYKLQDSYQFMGLPIAIENKAGSYREGIDPDGHKWKQKMSLDYGYIKKTEGADGEGIDVYIGDNPEADKVYIVKQHKIEAVKKWKSEYCPKCGEHVHDCGCSDYYDEDKVFLGFDSKQAVKEAYLKQYDSPLFLGPISIMNLDAFHDLFEDTDSPDLPWQLAIAESALDWRDQIKSAVSIDGLKEAARNALYLIANKKENESIIPDYSYDTHKEVAGLIRRGELSADQLRRLYKQFQEQIPEIQEKLKSKTIKELAPKGAGGYKKPEIIEKIIGQMRGIFVLGDVFSYSPFSESIEQAMDRLLGNYTDEDIQKTAQERRERIARIKKAYENPETLSEFRDFISRKGFESLSPEQKEKYDELIAGQTKQFSEQQKTQKKDVQTASVTTTAELIETTHTRDNYPLFVIQLQERLEKEDYYKLLNSAKKMGGWYSSFSKNGAIPGFQFKDKESAQAFQKLVETGDKQDVQSLVVDNKQQDDIEKQKNAANRLKQSADKIISKAQEKLSADRLSNTARRAAQAASMEKTANQSIQLACSMKNIANALEKGQAKHLSGISNTKQVEQINNALKRAAYNERLKKYSTYSERLSHEDEAATSASVEFAESMFPKIYTDNMGEVFEKLDGKRGYASLVKKYKSVFSGKEFYQPSNKSEMDELADMILSADLGSYSMLTMSVERYKRWIGMGIENDSMLRAALREYVQYNAEQPEEDKVKALERAVVGRKVGIDFFPTPKHVATDIVDMADIKPGMRVLEPSAGNGNIAEVIREAGVEPDTIEISTELGEILKAKGFNIVGSDFLESDQKYDRIVMNPPFGNGMDIDHVKHAYDLLLPGGKLVAIMGEGCFFRGDKKATEFRNWLDLVGGTSEKLDEKTFTDKSLLATTGANARVVIIEKENQIMETALKDSLIFESASDWKEQIRNAHSIDEMVQVARDLLVIENASRSRREYVDTGEKIGGAKKDVWAAILAGQKALDAGDLEGMDSGTANKLVNKKNVTRDTLQSCIDKGADPGAVFLMNKILGGYDVKPGDTDLARESYVKGHALVQEYFQTATSVKDIIDIIHYMQEELTGYNLSPEEKQLKDEFDRKVKAYNKARADKWGEIVADFNKRSVKFNRDKASTQLYDWEKANKANIVAPEEISEMNKKVREWHKREDENPDSKRNLYKSLGDKFVNLIKGKSQAFEDNIRKAEDMKDFSFLESTKEAKPRETAYKPKWSRSVPENVELTRSDAVNFKPEDLTSKFGIRGVEYGNWVDEESAKHHTQMLGLSFLDLSDILGIAPDKVSYGGRLGIRFGSNGSGSASAHYEPDYKAINMTKFNGGGSLAHEWGHFLDNIVHMVSHDGEVKHSFGSDSVSGKKTVSKRATTPFGDKLPKDVENAFTEIHKLMTEGNEGRNESKPDDPGFTSYNANMISTQISKLGPQGAMDYFANQTRGRWSKAKRETVRTPIYNTEMLQKIADFIHFKTGEKVLFGEGKSKFLYTSSSWGGEYWKRPHELFARAFEAIVNKKMKDRGARNTYLVYGVDPVDGAPYPDNDELEKLEPAFDKLIALLKENKILERAMEINPVFEASGDWKEQIRQAVTLDNLKLVFKNVLNKDKQFYQMTEAQHQKKDIGSHRAKPGGEIGANGEWYEGGKFIARNPDRAKGQSKWKKPTGKKEIEPFVWDYPPDITDGSHGLLPMKDILVTEIYDHKTKLFSFNENLNPNYARAYEERIENIKMYNDGVRWREIDLETGRQTGRFFDKNGVSFTGRIQDGAIKQDTL